jgi:hypothetical protein
MDATGTPFTGPWSAVAPTLILATAETAVAVRLPVRRVQGPEPEPDPTD